MSDQHYMSNSITVLQSSKIVNKSKFRTKWQLQQLPLCDQPKSSSVDCLTGNTSGFSNGSSCSSTIQECKDLKNSHAFCKNHSQHHRTFTFISHFNSTDHTIHTQRMDSADMGVHSWNGDYTSICCQFQTLLVFTTLIPCKVLQLITWYPPHWWHILCGTRGQRTGGGHTCKSLHKIFPRDPSELMHDVFQEIHLKQKHKHILSYAVV